MGIFFINFLDRALDMLGLLYLLKGVWMVARGYGARRAFLMGPKPTVPVDFLGRPVVALLLAVFMAALLWPGTVMAQPAPAFRLCTGIKDGNYFTSGHFLKKASGTKVDVLETQGSLDNLEKLLRGECDGAFVQSDSMLVFARKNAAAISTIERAGVLYQEHAHLLCNRSAGIGRVTDLRGSHTVAIGPEGAGANTTWSAFVLADEKRYKPVKTDTRSNLRGLAAVADGSDVQCLLWIGALGSSFMKSDAQQTGDRSVLVPTDDWDMGKVAKDGRGKDVYAYSEIPSNTYKRIQHATMFGTQAVKTITVDALFVANVNWINANDKAYNSVLRGFAGAKPAITDLVTPK